MSRCKNCNLEILDETEYCPLCQSVLAENEIMENMYPDMRITLRRRMLFARIYLFCAIFAEAVLVSINLQISSEIWWSVITGMVLLWIYMIVRYTIIGNSDYRIKVVTAAVILVLMSVGIDIVIGYRGWSVDYVLPSMILILDAVILGCMIWNHKNWQSYMMWQILMILCSIIPAVLYIKGLERNPYLALSPLAVSVLLFSGTVIIGDRRAHTELKRRFHIR
ncbi:MAG: DUF6320 domain-containing protein [Schaedlerella sp.]|nr:DUF6320 domain-containing protein [Schaedlerella sp.]